MRGPIDYIIVGFEGNKFDGKIIEALTKAAESGVIDILALALVSKNSDGVVSTIDATEIGDDILINVTQSIKTDNSMVSKEDIDEVGDLLKDNTTAGLLVIEQLWAKPLKEALVNANGVLVAEGRIHPEAAEELNN